MTSEENKKIILRLFGQGMLERKFEVFNELIAESFINHGIPNAETGPTGFKMFALQLFKAFPNLKIILEEVIAENDIVAVRGYIHGTHQGEFMGIHPTGKKINISYFDFWKIRDGKCIENWAPLEMTGIMQQLGPLQFAF